MIETWAIIVAMVATTVACLTELRRRDDRAHSERMFQDEVAAGNRLAAENFALKCSADAEPPAWLERKVRQRVIVHTVDERSYEGLLDVTATDGLVLIGARMLSEGGATVAGEMFIPRSQVLFVQRPRGEE